MKKIEFYLAHRLNQALQEEYGLTLSDRNAIGLCRYLINTYRGQETTKPRGMKKLVWLYELWYRTVKLPEKEKVNHSAYWLVKYISRYYWVIIIPKLFKS